MKTEKTADYLEGGGTLTLFDTSGLKNKKWEHSQDAKGNFVDESGAYAFQLDYVADSRPNPPTNQEGFMSFMHSSVMSQVGKHAFHDEKKEDSEGIGHFLTSSVLSKLSNGGGTKVGQKSAIGSAGDDSGNGNDGVSDPTDQHEGGEEEKEDKEKDKDDKEKDKDDKDKDDKKKETEDDKDKENDKKDDDDDDKEKKDKKDDKNNKADKEKKKNTKHHWRGKIWWKTYPGRAGRGPSPEMIRVNDVILKTWNHGRTLND
jgi:hypothetical protein